MWDLSGTGLMGQAVKNIVLKILVPDSQKLCLKGCGLTLRRLTCHLFLVHIEDTELAGYIEFEDGSVPPYFASHNGPMDDESPFFSCRFCPFSTDSSNAVAQHVCPRMIAGQGRSRMGGERPYRCGFCSSAFFQRAHLDGHILTHTGERPFRCAICEQAFSRKSNMLRHMKTHSAAT
ncbi:uncharacterized protein LOC144159155 isoform X5 [Haemaphysalis longicornis]